MSSRRRYEHESSSRREAYKLWTPAESDSDHRPRQTMTMSQRPNVDQATPAVPEKHHRSRRVDGPGDLPSSSHHRAASKEQANPAAPSSSYYTVAQAQAQLLQNTVPLADSSQPASGSSRPRIKEPSKESHSLRTYLKRKTEKRSSPESDEKILVEHTQSTRSGKQSRDVYQSGDTAAHAPSTTQTYWIPPDQKPKESSSSKQQRDSEKEKERERRHVEKARLKEEERARRKADERARVKEEERARERAAETERDRRRAKDSERERRRHEKERDKERGSRHRDSEKIRDHQSRRREDARYQGYSNGHSQAYNTASQPRWANTDDRISTRQIYPDQIPSSNSNVALPSSQYTSTAAPTSSRPYVSSVDPPRGNLYPPGMVPEKKHHRSHHDKTPQYGTQESGLSSSEQESGRERATRVVDRKRATGNATDAPSGPSGSETERTGKERRKHRPHESDPYAQGRTGVSQKPPAVASSGTQMAQIASVGSNPTPYKPHIVSIRAGQGPSDQPVSLAPPKISAPDTGSGRPYGTQQDVGARLPPGSYLQVPPEVYGSARAANSFSLQNGQIHSQSSQQQTLTASHVPLQPANFSYSGQHYQDLIARVPSTGPIPPVKQSALTVTPNYSGPLPPLPAGSRAAPSPRHQIQSLPVLPKGDTQLTSPYKADSQVLAPPIGGASFAKLSVYRAPDTLVAGELTFNPPFAASLTQHEGDRLQGNHLQMDGSGPRDVSSRFPLNEEAAHSSTARTTQTAVPPISSRSATFPPVIGIHTMHPYATPPSPMQSSSHRPYPQPGEDTPRAAPIPIPEPRSMTALAHVQAQTQAASASNPNLPIQPHDPRSPKHALVTPAPILSSAPLQPTRPHASPLQSAPAIISQFNVPPGVPTPDISSGADPSPVRSTHPAVSPSTPAANYASHSPSRSTQINISRSSPAAAVSTLTPKQSPSGRMHFRNGSSDTISQGAAKQSPSSHREKILTQRTSISNMQSSHANSRQDTTTVYQRQPPSATANAGYPESNRYRTTTLPQTQPQPHSQYPAQHAPVSTSTSQPQLPYSTVANSGASSSRPNPESSTAFHSVPQYDLNTHRSQPTPALPGASTSQPISSASAIAAAYRNGTYHEIVSRPHDPAISSRVPPRSVPPPSATGAVRQYPSMLSTTKTPHGVGSLASPQPMRGQTFPVPGYGRAATAAPTTSHVRSASDSQFGVVNRIPASTHPATLAPVKHTLEALRISSSPVEPEQLRTPSSLAPSMSRHNSFAPSIAPSVTPSKEKEKKKSFFGLFRSRSSPPKPAEVKFPATPVPKAAGQTHSRPRASSQTTMQAVATSVKNIVTPHPTDIHTPTPIVAPTPILPLNSVHVNGDRKSPGSKMFTSFRLISKRHRTVSAASVEAMDGTAPNTVIGGESVRSSTAGRPSPPLRDPAIATFDWRNREEAGQTSKGTGRRHRPGVTFDFEDDVIDEASTVARPVRRSSRRYETR